MQDKVIAKRITQIRSAVWIASSLLAFLCLRSAWPLAWQAAAFGALFTLLWPLVRGQREKKEIEGEETGDRGQGTVLPNTQYPTPDTQFNPQPLAPATIEIGLDLTVATMLIAVSGGLVSPFAPLVFGVALEAYALLGRRGAVYTALGAALVNLIHFRAGVTPTAAILYSLALGLLGAAGMAAKLAQARKEEEDTRQSGAAFIRPPDVAELQAQLEAAHRAREQMKDNYRAITNLHQDQQAQLARTRIVEQLAEISAGMEGDDPLGSAGFSRVLRLVMDITGANGGVLWLRGRDGRTLMVQSAEGRIANNIRHDTLPHLDALTPDGVRAHCEAVLLNAVSAAQPAPSRLDALFAAPSDNETGNDGNKQNDVNAPGAYAVVTQAYAFPPSPTGKFEEAQSSNEIPLSDKSYRLEEADGLYAITDVANEYDLLLAPSSASVGSAVSRNQLPPANPGLVGVTLLRTRATPSEPNGSVLGAIGICDPRGRQKFLSSELEKVSSLCRALTAAVSILRERAEAQRRLREVARLDELSCTARNPMNVNRNKSMDAEQVYSHVVEQVMAYVPCENCTLFLLDKRGQRLEAKATRGRIVNLLDHIRFERGHGVSGWVAASGKPLHIADLTQEPNLLHVETIPLQVRSFVAIPVRVQNAIVGVLNVSHALPHAFTPGDTRLLTELSAQAATLLERAATQAIGV